MGESTPVLWTIAGHDPSSGAGITADLLTFAAHGFYGVSVPTALTVQSTLGVQAIEPTRAEFFRAALQALATDLPPTGIKIGMTGSYEIVREIAAFLATTLQDQSRNSQIQIVFDPVVRSSSGHDLAEDETLQAILDKLLPLVNVITPNFAELAALAGREVATPHDALAAAADLGSLFPQLTIIATAGDQAQPQDIVRLASGHTQLLLGEHIESTSTHGTGCAFSSALVCQLASGLTLVEAATRAKQFVEQGIRSAPSIGQGRGPLNLFRRPQFTDLPAKSRISQKHPEPSE